MNIRLQIDQELAAAAQVGGPARIEVPLGSGRVIMELLAVDSIGCGLDFLCYETSTLAHASIPDLQKIATKLQSLVSYLFEPIGLLEIDREACVLQLRSMPPDHDLESVRYYELWVRKGGEIALTRYRKRRGKMRERIAAQLTREVVSRLAHDFVRSTE